MTDKDLQLQQKQEVAGRAEATRNVPTFIPPVDIYESKAELTLLADMPGVPIENVEIDLNRDQLTIKGSATLDDGRPNALVQEYSAGDYLRQFTLSREIDREGIAASMKDGVLKVVLPKAEVAKPRRIAVNAS